MTVLYLLFYLLAAILFLLSGLNVPGRRTNLVAFGLLFWVLVPLTQLLAKS